MLLEIEHLSTDAYIYCQVFNFPMSTLYSMRPGFACCIFAKILHVKNTTPQNVERFLYVLHITAQVTTFSQLLAIFSLPYVSYRFCQPSPEVRSFFVAFFTSWDLGNGFPTGCPIPVFLFSRPRGFLFLCHPRLSMLLFGSSAYNSKDYSVRKK